jgi:hypothetical protein
VAKLGHGALHMLLFVGGCLSLLSGQVFTEVPDWRPRIAMALLSQRSRPILLVVLGVVEPGHGASRRLLCQDLGGVPNWRQRITMVPPMPCPFHVFLRCSWSSGRGMMFLSFFASWKGDQVCQCYATHEFCEDLECLDEFMLVIGRYSYRE